jgi:hypothetical protein
MTVGELGVRMDAAEFAEWAAFAALEPFGSRVDDLRFGAVASAAGAMAGIKTAPGDWFRWQAGDAKPAGNWQDIYAGFGAYAVPASPAPQPGAG